MARDRQRQSVCNLCIVSNPGPGSEFFFMSRILYHENILLSYITEKVKEKRLNISESI